MPEITEVQVAVGYDNPDDILPFWQLDPPAFWQNELGVMTTWNSEEAMRKSGDRDGRRVGKPWVTLTFQVVSEAEADLLDGLVGRVTLNVRKKQGGTWVTYNGKLQPVAWGSFRQLQGHFIDVIVEVLGLTELT